jgi:hypothetical protein
MTWLSSVEEAFWPPGAELVAGWVSGVWLEFVLVGSAVAEPEVGDGPV